MVPNVITMDYLVIRPWGCFSLAGFYVVSPNSAVMLHRIAGSSGGTGIIQAHNFSSKCGYRWRQETKGSKCRVPVADLRQGYVGAVLDTLPVWAGGNGAETKVALLIFPPCYFSWTNMNSTSKVLYFPPLFLLFAPLTAGLCWDLHVLPWGGKNLIFFFNFFFF